MLSVGPGHVKLLQPGPKVASNPNEPYIQDLSKLPQPGTEIPIDINDPCIIHTAKGSSKPPQPGPEEANSSVDLYATCMTKTRPEPFLGP